ncbi:MAG: hypothetical protein QGI68_15210 [Pseudomonadales bacterium]|jgi:hypothetical protein|nr:hypothetical protein [Pseudomonadales bacterium]MDP7596897.1 hypothetical protein [Pseudomonadales bacterium]HJN51722.1 hypothetical protein [Pseudomonadales bacterium]|tara:strand:+ start:514 stop:1002 length:489 start_codon:yes stop_codon:yes gene_type:complete
MNPFRNLRGAILLRVLGVLGAAALTAGVVYFFYCPCERTSGGWLLGTEIPEPVSDWSFANQVPLCQIQVSGWLPHSVNLNCMSSSGKLYLSCASCEGKRWSTLALANPNGRIRMNESVYPVTLTRVEDPEVLDEAWQARAAKFSRQARPRPETWWSFSLKSR